MGIKNSRVTRVQPLFDKIGKSIDKISELLSLFKRNVEIGTHVINLEYGDTEIALPPPRSLLQWCIERSFKLIFQANTRREYHDIDKHD